MKVRKIVTSVGLVAFIGSTLVSSDGTANQIKGANQVSLEDVLLELRYDNSFVDGVESSSDVDALKSRGITKVLLDMSSGIDTREPTEFELKSIERALDTAPYCSVLATQLLLSHRQLISINKSPHYAGNSLLPATIKLVIPTNPSLLDEFEPQSGKMKSVWITPQEELRATYLHECAHKIENVIFDYYNLNNLKIGKSLVDSLDVLNGYRLSEDVHPLYRVFAELEGMQLVGGGIYIEGSRRIPSPGKKYKIQDNRIGHYFTDRISEYFAELFAISRLKPEALTDKERIFFDNLHDGISKYGLPFLESVAKNPRVLLDDHKGSGKAISYQSIVPTRIELAFAERLKKLGMKALNLEGSRPITAQEADAMLEAYTLAPYCAQLFALKLNISGEGSWGTSNSKGITLFIPEAYPSTATIEEIISEWRHGILHECGHSVDGKVAIYSKGETLRDQSTNPLYRILAEAKGAELVEDATFGDPKFKVYRLNNGRLPPYYDSTSEYFAELFARSITNPEQLTDLERQIFSNLHKGIRSKGDKFLAEVARNPNILLGNGPKAKSLQYIGNSRERDFYAQHGYFRTPPKILIKK